MISSTLSLKANSAFGMETASECWISMKVLLDTCTILWASLAPSTLSPVGQQIVADPANVILVSAASTWEIATPKFAWASFQVRKSSNATTYR